MSRIGEKIFGSLNWAQRLTGPREDGECGVHTLGFASIQ